jgi:hypothetical protein
MNAKMCEFAPLMKISNFATIKDSISSACYFEEVV